MHDSLKHHLHFFLKYACEKEGMNNKKKGIFCQNIIVSVNTLTSPFLLNVLSFFFFFAPSSNHYLL